MTLAKRKKHRNYIKKNPKSTGTIGHIIPFSIYVLDKILYRWMWFFSCLRILHWYYCYVMPTYYTIKITIIIINIWLSWNAYDT